MPELAPEEEVWTYFETLSNWGRWGEDDQLGTLNLITPAKRTEAAALVKEGLVVSLADVMDPHEPDPQGRGSLLQRYMMLYGGTDTEMGLATIGKNFGAREFIGIVPHGSFAHMDTLAHIGYDGKYYNGFPTTETSTIDGAKKLDTAILTEGVVTRGVLLDVCALKGKEWLDPGEHVFPEDLEAAEERQGVRVGSGDVCILNTGAAKRIAAEGVHPQGHHSGYSARCMPWLRERDVAMLTSDTINEVMPTGYGAPELIIPVHLVALVAMGLWLTDNLVLTDLAETCARLERWEFMFSMAPWLLMGATSSPVNPLAIF